MGQFAVHRNGNPDTRAKVPYLLDVQSNLVSELETRVVVPLYPAKSMKGRTVRNLMPLIEIEGKPLVMVTPEMAGVPRRNLGPVVADATHLRGEILSAIDFLLLGF